MPDQTVPDLISVVVTDMAASVDFYRLVGVELPEAGDPWEGFHRSATTPGGLGLDLDLASFANQWNEGWDAASGGVVVGFKLPTREAVDSTYEAIVAAGHTGQQPPYDAFWGARYAVVLDPDGNAVGLMSPMDPAFRSEPPPPPG